MLALTTERLMPAKKKAGRPKTGTDNASAKVDVEVLSMAKHIALYEKRSLAEYISETLRPIVEKRMQQIAAEMLKPKK